MTNKPYNGVAVNFKSDDNPWVWLVTIDGEQEFAGGKFEVELDMNEFPFQAPKIKFLTKVYHPNISKDGEICTKALESDWVPTKNAFDVLDFVITTFKCPNDENPQDNDIAMHWKSNKTTWGAKAAEWTQLYAKK